MGDTKNKDVPIGNTKMKLTQFQIQEILRKDMEKKTVANNWIVKCPHCGAEYHLTEIAMPGELLGKPKTHGIIKDPLGKILYIDWDEEPITEFDYTCDSCEKDFVVKVQLVAKAEAKPEETDFSQLSTSLL